MLKASKYARSNRLLIHVQTSKVCTEQSFTQVCSKLRSLHGATLFLCHALSIEVCTAADQPFTQSVMLGASKYAPKYAPNNRRLLSHARSTEVCTEQTYTRSCSEYRSMHGATVYLVVLGASKYARKPFTQSCSEHREYAWINRFSIMYGRTLVNFLSLFCFLFQLQECALVPLYGIPSMLGTFCFHRHGACLEANASMRTDARAG